MVGYVCYVDRFSSTLAGLQRHLDYLEEIKVTYLQLMPLLRPRPVPNDGRYALSAPRPALASGEHFAVHEGRIEMPALGFLWLIDG